MDKKAVELSINIIILIVIGLIILIVVSVMFASQAGNYGKALNDCKSKGGTCASKCDPGFAAFLNTNCNADGKGTNDLCCVPVLT